METARRWARECAVVLVFFALGAWVTHCYVNETPYTVRAHDVRGHLEHIDYLFEQQRSHPPTGAGASLRAPSSYSGRS